MREAFKHFNKRYFPDGIIAFILYNTIYEKLINPLLVDYLESIGATILQQRWIDIMLYILGFCLYQIVVKDGKEHIADIKKAYSTIKNLICKSVKKIKNKTIKVLATICKKLGTMFSELSKRLEQNIQE